MNSRRGVTIIEFLVVVSVLAVLAAILLPAILSVRESQRRVACQSNLTNVMQALGQFESTHARYPAPLDGGPANSIGVTSSFSPFARLLPYLEQRPLFDKIDFSLVVIAPTDPTAKNQPLSEVLLTRVPAYVCPSDARHGGPLPAHSYRVCLGIGPDYSEYSGASSTGAFTAGRSLRSSDFRDGLGTTVALSERKCGAWRSGWFSPPEDFWYTGLDQIGIFPPVDELVEICEGVSDAPPQVYEYSGGTWLYGCYENTWYNHSIPPNSAVPACSAGVSGAPFGPRTSYAVVGASSWHSGGVNTAFLDGHTKFISDSIDLRIWRALATRAGEERLSEGDY